MPSIGDGDSLLLPNSEPEAPEFKNQAGVIDRHCCIERFGENQEFNKEDILDITHQPSAGTRELRGY